MMRTEPVEHANGNVPTAAPSGPAFVYRYRTDMALFCLEYIQRTAALRRIRGCL